MYKWKKHFSRCRLNFQMRRLIHSMTGKKHLLAHDCMTFFRELFTGPCAPIPEKPFFYSGSGAGAARYCINPSVLASESDM